MILSTINLNLDRRLNGIWLRLLIDLDVIKLSIVGRGKLISKHVETSIVLKLKAALILRLIRRSIPFSFLYMA